MPELLLISIDKRTSNIVTHGAVAPTPFGSHREMEKSPSSDSTSGWIASRLLCLCGLELRAAAGPRGKRCCAA